MQFNEYGSEDLVARDGLPAFAEARFLAFRSQAHTEATKHNEWTPQSLSDLETSSVLPSRWPLPVIKQLQKISGRFIRVLPLPFGDSLNLARGAVL